HDPRLGVLRTEGQTMHALRSNLALAFASALGAFFLSTPASAGVLVVNAAGGAPYTTIQAAVDAAIDGDTVHVKAGNYTSFTISNKSISVAADAGAHPYISGGVRVQSLLA